MYAEIEKVCVCVVCVEVRWTHKIQAAYQILLLFNGVITGLYFQEFTFTFT